jgi:hypothetical protein
MTVPELRTRQIAWRLQAESEDELPEETRQLALQAGVTGRTMNGWVYTWIRTRTPKWKSVFPDSLGNSYRMSSCGHSGARGKT